jgi:hypothetical protein
MLLLHLVPDLLGFFKNRGDQNLQEKAQMWAYRTEYMKATNNVETTIMRQLIVALFVASIFFDALNTKMLAAGLTANWRMLIIGWEFFGAEILGIIPWYKNPGIKNGNGNGNGHDAPKPSDPTPSSDDRPGAP